VHAQLAGNYGINPAGFRSALLRRGECLTTTDQRGGGNKSGANFYTKNSTGIFLQKFKIKNNSVACFSTRHVHWVSFV
jgi:hypothetical protein